MNMLAGLSIAELVVIKDVLHVSLMQSQQVLMRILGS